MNIKFKTLSMKNFLSYGAIPTVLNLDRPGTTMIVGEDLDYTSSGDGSNGVGKTVILNALSYACYDKAVSSISKDNLINDVNKKHMEVTIEFEASNGKQYKIVRARKMKAGAAGNYVQLFEDGRDITPDSVGNTNRAIEKIIGMPHELFVRIVAFSATSTPFLDLPVRSHYAANQTDIIEELFNLKNLSEKAVLLKDKIKETEQSMTTQQERIKQLEQEHKRHHAQIKSAKNRVVNWHTSNKDDIETIKKKLKKIESVDVDQQRRLQNELNNVDNQLREAIDEQRRVESDIASTEADIAALEIEIEKAQGKLTHLRDDKCPYCLQKYKDANTKIAENEYIIANDEATLEELREQLTKLEQDLELAELQVETLSSQHKELKKQITVNDIDELLEIKSKMTHYQKRLEDLQTMDNPHVEPLDELEAIELDPIDNKEINRLKELLDHQKFLLKLLTKKDSFVRKTLLNKNIPFLNRRLAHYLTELGLRHKVEFTHEMTASISQFGRPKDFGNLSNGQRARVNLALSFAFSDVLQSMHGKINVCMLDEVLDTGLDTVGVQLAAKLLKKKAREEKLSLYIISHRDEINSAFDSTLTVQMSKGFSYIIEDE